MKLSQETCLKYINIFFGEGEKHLKLSILTICLFSDDKSLTDWIGLFLCKNKKGEVI